MRRWVRTPEYVAWVNMIARCENTSQTNYDRYGGRGISVCERWRHSFEDFLSDMGRRPSTRHSIDRIDNDGNYEPSNVRWAPWEQQQRNRSSNRRITAFGATKTLAEWSDDTGIERGTIAARLKSEWPTELALTAPLLPKLFAYQGEMLTTRQIALRTGVPANSLGRRLARHGDDVTTAIAEWRRNGRGKKDRKNEQRID